ncbi:hypothetical protein [Paenibacillus polymyxa]|uniref:hypothetical protein n=1 Tax=Paenibacillus TaxID=44249 RepID=UPI002024B501|nr:hypothetical protein [Paenibacillus polymyxa]URJ38778.1 hypothetical protein MF627_003234 [Paenibacillus polymyxa]
MRWRKCQVPVSLRTSAINVPIPYVLQIVGKGKGQRYSRIAVFYALLTFLVGFITHEFVAEAKSI